MYEQAVTSPHTWGEESAVEWGNDAFTSGAPPREVVRQLRRAIRMSVKLADFWRDPPATVPDDGGEWRTRVDLALGPRAWRPVLEIARAALDRQPSEELFREVKDRFRVVNSEFWMEGVTYEEWLAARPE